VSRRAEEALRQSEEQYRSLAHTVDSIYIVDAEQRYLFMNEGHLKRFGMPLERIVGRPYSDFHSKEDSEEFAQTVKIVFETGTSIQQDHTSARDGRFFIRTFSPVVGHSGEVRTVTVVSKDITDRKQAEEALRQLNFELEQRVSERTAELRVASLYARSLIEAGLDSLVTISPEGRITDVNEATEQVTGRTRRELIGADFSDYFTDPDSAQMVYRAVLTDGQVRDYPLTIRHTSGNATDVLYNATVYRNQAGDIQGVLAAARDITERKRAEEAVAKERQRFYDVLETLPAYVVLLTPDYHVPFANRFFRERFGESHGRRCYEYLFKCTEPCETCETYTVLKTGKPHHWEWLGPDGRNYDIFDFPFTDTEGSPLIMEVGIDITEVKRAEAALKEVNETLEQRVAERTAELRESESKILEALEFNKTILNTSSIGILTYKESGQCTYANDAVAKIVGTNVAGLLEQNFHQIQSWKKSGMYELALKALRTGTEQRIEPLITTTLGKDIWPSLRFSSFYSEGENHLLVFVYDITEQKRAEEAIKASHQQLRAFAGRLQSVREEQRKEIAREIHDELGGALTGLKIDLSFLASSAPKSRDKTKRDSFLSKMLEMTKLIDETIGTVRRIVTKLRPSILDDFGLLAALEWQLQEFQKRTGIQSEFVSTLEYINLDEELSTAVFRIFQESLTNVARHAKATKVTATLYKEADSLVLKVEDNGKGISADDIHNTKSVGLIGMREHALFLGGTVNFSGEPSKGTTISVQFPFESQKGTGKIPGETRKKK